MLQTELIFTFIDISIAGSCPAITFTKRTNETRKFMIYRTLVIVIATWFSCLATDTKADIVYSIGSESNFSEAGWKLNGGTITTDESVGSLVTGNVVGWTISFDSPSGTRTFSNNDPLSFFEHSDETADSLFTATNQELVLTAGNQSSTEGDSLFFDSGTGYSIRFHGANTISARIILSDTDLTGDPYESIATIGSGNFTVASVPEPSSCTLLCFATLLICRRRKVTTRK